MMNVLKNILCLTIGCFLATEVGAQAVKQIEVSHEQSFTDHLSLQQDSKDMDLMVKFIFNESANTLTVSLISYRGLFVFREDARYAQVVRKKQIMPDKLPYVVTTEPFCKYKFGKDFKKSIDKPRKKYIFKRWIDYDGLQPIPFEYKMVNDYIEQSFDILNKNTSVKITLRDILVMNPFQKAKGKKKLYLFLLKKDLDRTYHISIKRNPCFGLEEETEAAEKTLESITTGYQNLYDRFGSGYVSNAESLKTFQEMKDLLVKQFPPKTEQSPCPGIQQKWDTYNQYLESIKALKCTVRTTQAEEKVPVGIGINADFILSQARLLDNCVSQWLASQDKIEKKDLIGQCKEIIKIVNETVTRNGVINAEQKNALALFREAERYFKATCLNVKK